MRRLGLWVGFIICVAALTTALILNILRIVEGDNVSLGRAALADPGSQIATEEGSQPMHPDLPPELTAPAGSFEVEFQVPDDLLSLGIELDDPEAAAEHAEFLDARLAENAPAELRRQALAQLAEVRGKLVDGQIRYLAVASAELDGRWVFCLFGVSLAGFAATPDFPPSHMLATALRHHYGEDWCLVEEFETDHGPAVGVRRCDLLTVPAEAHEPGQDQHIDTGVAQAMVIFPELEVTGVVSGHCLDPDDIDLTAALVATIAHTLRVTAAEPQVPMPQ